MSNTATIADGTTVERGDYVVYQGSISWYSGWTFQVAGIGIDGHLYLTEYGSGVRLSNVRSASVRSAAL